MAVIELVNTGTASGEAICPPEDVYTLVLQEYGEVEQRPVYEDMNKPAGEQRMQNQIKMTFRIVSTSDDDDEELAGWIGETLNDWITIPKNPLHEKAKIGNLARAILKVKEFPVGEVIRLEELVELSFKAKITPKASGWPKIDGFMPARGKAKAAPSFMTRRNHTPASVADVEESGEWPEE